VPGGATGAVDQALGGAIREAIDAGDLRGKKGEVTVFYTRGAIPAPRVLLVGLGPRMASACRTSGSCGQCGEKGPRSGRYLVLQHRPWAGVGGMDPQAAAQAVVEGTILACTATRSSKVRTRTA